MNSEEDEFKRIEAEALRLKVKIEQEPSQWRDMVVVTLVREGIDKHKARELADHFAAQPEQEPVEQYAKLAQHCEMLEHKLALIEQEPVAFYHPRNGFYWAKPTSIFAPTAVDVPPMPLYAAAERNHG